MCRTLGKGIVFFGILAASGCSEPGPTQPGGGFQLPPEAKKAQEEAALKTPEQQKESMEKMMQSKPSAKK